MGFKGIAVLVTDLELDANFQRDFIGKFTPRDFGEVFLVYFAIAIGWCDHDLAAFADSQAIKAIFEAGDYLALTLEKFDGSGIAGLVNNFAIHS